jgi:hypothetical protein
MGGEEIAEKQTRSGLETLVLRCWFGVTRTALEW